MVIITLFSHISIFFVKNRFKMNAANAKKISSEATQNVHYDQSKQKQIYFGSQKKPKVHTGDSCVSGFLQCARSLNVHTRLSGMCQSND